MGLDCGAKCLKVTLIIFNVLFWICGAAILGVGIWMAVDEDAFETLDIMNPEGMDYALWQAAVFTSIGVGAFVFLVGFLGWMGACMENECLLMTYAVLAGIALVGEIVCAVLALVFQDSIDAEVEQSMYLDIRDEYTTVDDDDDNAYVVTWNNFQTKMKCCGSYNYTDWADNPNYGPFRNPPIPWTCCQMNERSSPPDIGDVINLAGCYSDAENTNPDLQINFQYLNNIGCHEALEQWVDENSVIIYGVMFGVMAIQVLGIVFACVLRCQLD